MDPLRTSRVEQSIEIFEESAWAISLNYSKINKVNNLYLPSAVFINSTSASGAEH